MRRTGTPVFLAIIFLALALMASQARAALPAEQPYSIDEHGRLTTEVYINGQGPFRFVIDTASSRSLIQEHVRKQLNLTQSQPGQMTVYGINDVAEVMPVKPHELRIAGETALDLTMGVLPETGPSGADGVLGIDVLARYFVVLDRGAMRIRLLPPGELSARAYRDWPDVQLTQRPLKKFPIQFWYLKARFNGSRINSLFDLGASLTMLNWDAAERLGVRKAHFESFGPPPALLQDVLGKEAPAVRADGLEVQLANRSWDKQFAIIADAPIFSYFDLEEQPAAIVGLDVLRNNSLAIDFSGQRLYLGPTIADGS
jgi:predicted aspartyl protease